MRAIVLALVIATVTFGQSYFNSRGLGEIPPTGDARIAGMGDPFALSTANPGMLVNLPQTSFSLTGIGVIAVGTSNGNTRAFGTARPSAIDIAIPLPVGARLYAGAREWFNQDFDIWSESLADTAYRRHVVARGGISSLNAGIAKSLFGKLAFAAGYVHVLGGAREDWRFEIDNGRYTAVDTVEIDYSANTFELGASYQHRLFSLAAHFQPATELTATRFRRVHGVVGDSEVGYHISVPYTLRLAAGATPMKTLSVALSLEIRPWSGTTIHRDAETTNVATGFVDSRRVSVGAEYELFDGYPIRAGYSFGDMYFNVPGADQTPTSIFEQTAHVGTSLPVPKFGSLDIAGEVVLRRATMTEVSGRLMLTLAYREAWGRRTRRWGY